MGHTPHPPRPRNLHKGSLAYANVPRSRQLVKGMRPPPHTHTLFQDYAGPPQPAEKARVREAGGGDEETSCAHTSPAPSRSSLGPGTGRGSPGASVSWAVKWVVSLLLGDVGLLVLTSKLWITISWFPTVGSVPSPTLQPNLPQKERFLKAHSSGVWVATLLVSTMNPSSSWTPALPSSALA